LDLHGCTGPNRAGCHIQASPQNWWTVIEEGGDLRVTHTDAGTPTVRKLTPYTTDPTSLCPIHVTTSPETGAAASEISSLLSPPIDLVQDLARPSPSRKLLPVATRYLSDSIRCPRYGVNRNCDIR
jgi:hypothetical protein